MTEMSEQLGRVTRLGQQGSGRWPASVTAETC